MDNVRAVLTVDIEPMVDRVLEDASEWIIQHPQVDDEEVEWARDIIEQLLSIIHFVVTNGSFLREEVIYESDDENCG